MVFFGNATLNKAKDKAFKFWIPFSSGSSLAYVTRQFPNAMQDFGYVRKRQRNKGSTKLLPSFKLQHLPLEVAREGQLGVHGTV